MNTSPKIPAPDPAVIAHYAVHVLGVQLAEWQRKALIDCVAGYGYASVAWADQLAETEDDDLTEPGPRAALGPALRNMAQQPPSEVAKGYNTGPATAHAAKRSDTPIGDTLPDPRNS